jgi:DNA-directed RNA polymerase specialized sigma24 family protein
MDTWQNPLHQIVRQACSHPLGSRERQKYLTRIIRSISPKLWRENVPYYADALQQTWVYFCQNICEANTGAAYDPQQASLVTWLNTYLKRRLQDGYLAIQKQQARTASIKVSLSGDDSENYDPVDHLAAKPDVPPLLEQVKQWAKTDRLRKLRRIYIEGRPDVNCQVLILRRLPPETPWKTLAEEFDIPSGTLSSFYQRQCLPRLREFGKSEGYL